MQKDWAFDRAVVEVKREVHRRTGKHISDNVASAILAMMRDVGKSMIDITHDMAKKQREAAGGHSH